MTSSALGEPRQVLYCGPCGYPLEYCEYSPDFESHCLPWIKKTHPEELRRWELSSSNDDDDDGAKKKSKPTEPWTTEERLTKFYEEYQPDKLDSVPGLLEKYAGKEEKLFQALVKKYGPEPEDPFFAEDDDDDDDADDDNEDEVTEQLEKVTIIDKATKKKRRGVGASKNKEDGGGMEPRVVIQKISRNRKKATTVVIGMETIPGLKLKDASKLFSKRFAGSSSVKDAANGKKEIIIQGDHMEEVGELLVSKFQVSGDSVYLDIDGKFVPYSQY